jgi:hypothetical protein
MKLLKDDDLHVGSKIYIQTHNFFYLEQFHLDPRPFTLRDVNVMVLKIIQIRLRGNEFDQSPYCI